MIKVRVAKTILENEEGMNHVWVQIAPITGDIENVRLQIVPPPGVHRRKNLNGFIEDRTGEIVIYDRKTPCDIFFEIFTREAVSVGERTIIFALSFNEKKGNSIRVEHFVPLTIVSDEEIENVIVDEEVVNKIKELYQTIDDYNDQRIEYSPAKLVRIDPNELSELEKKYRIEGTRF